MRVKDHTIQPHPSSFSIPMYVTNLSLRDFRNYQRLDLSLGTGTTLFYGSNAAGKTSLLEALFYLATTRSMRATTDRELIRWGTTGEVGAPPFARLVTEVQQTKQRVRLEVIIQLRTEERALSTTERQPYAQGTAQKLVRINRKPMRALDLVGQLRVVLFTPADLALVYGAPAERRRYLDITLSQINPQYLRTLSQYHKLVQQRNSLLRAWRERRRPQRAVNDELGYWDQEVAATGGYLLAERLQAVADLNTLVGPLFRDITGSSQPLQVDYQASFDLPEATDAAGLAQQLSNTLLALRADEMQRGQTLIGPHRDDLLFTTSNINLGTYGSRGQQRSTALALKLAEARLMELRTGDAPVLLLDDLLSELDLQRRTHLLRVISQPEQQTLLTSTDLSSFDADFLQQATCFRVEEGHIYAV